MSDQPDAQTSTWQHTTLPRDIHAPGGIRNRNTSKQADEDPRLRPRGHLDRFSFLQTYQNFTLDFIVQS